MPTELGLSEPVAITLVRRGYRTPEEARAFLEADESHEPAEFGSMGAVVERVLAAIARRAADHRPRRLRRRRRLRDAILVATLRELGAECDWLIPDRLADGYGLERGERRAAGASAAPRC